MLSSLEMVFLLVVELFSFSVMADALRANIDSKSAFLKGVGVGQFGPKLQVGNNIPTNHLCTDTRASECLTTLPLKVFTQISFVADFLRKKSTFIRKTDTLRF